MAWGYPSESEMMSWIALKFESLFVTATVLKKGFGSAYGFVSASANPLTSESQFHWSSVFAIMSGSGFEST